LNQYLSEYELESIACLPEELDFLTLNHPNSSYEIRLSNKSVEVGAEHTILTVFVLYDAPSLDDAVEIGRTYIKEFTDYLTFSTSIKFKVGHLLTVADWTKGITDRHCYIFQRFPGDERPYPIIDQQIIDSLETVLEAELSSKLKRVLRWFSRGVSAEYMDDQYQCFWFSIELLASIHKGTNKVNDICAKCRQPLYCENCKTYPTHKPYTKQAIHHLFHLMVSGDSDEAFKLLNDIRNALMHGDDIKLIEENKNIDFSLCVDKLGHIAWVSIFNTIMDSFKEKKQIKLNLIQAESFCLKTMNIHTHISFTSQDPENPKVEDIPNIQISAVYDQQK
tara:strand:+ start:2153 stop:3157 length:1005 start_codon:yes stop_codon:yes gene_type:complete